MYYQGFKYGAKLVNDIGWLATQLTMARLTHWLNI